MTTHLTTDIPAGLATLLDTALFDAAEVTRTGVVYLLHFDRPYRHAAHYTGWTLNLPHRLDKHATGHDARLLAVIGAYGVGWQLARTWTGDRNRERALKNQGGASRRCPLCGIHPRDIDPDMATDARTAFTNNPRECA